MQQATALHEDYRQEAQLNKQYAIARQYKANAGQ